MKNKQKHYISIPKYTSWQEALGYMDDICHKRKLPFDPHKLKTFIEEDVKVMIKNHNELLRESYVLRKNYEFLTYCIKYMKIDFMKLFEIGLERYNYIYRNKYNCVSLYTYQKLYNIIMKGELLDEQA